MRICRTLSWIRTNKQLSVARKPRFCYNCMEVSGVNYRHFYKWRLVSRNCIGSSDIKRCLPKSAYIIGQLTMPVLLRSLLRSSCYSFVARMVISGNPHSSEELDIYSSNTVIVRLIAALTMVQVFVIVTAFLVDSPAFGTTL